MFGTIFCISLLLELSLLGLFLPGNLTISSLTKLRILTNEVNYSEITKGTVTYDTSMLKF